MSDQPKKLNKPDGNEIVAIGLLAVAEELQLVRQNQLRQMQDSAPAYSAAMTDKLRELLKARGVL